MPGRKRGFRTPRKGLDRIAWKPFLQISKGKKFIPEVRYFGRDSQLSYISDRSTKTKSRRFADKVINACIARPRVADYVARKYSRAGYPRLAKMMYGLGEIKAIAVSKRKDFIMRLANDPKLRAEWKKKVRATITKDLRDQIVKEMLEGARVDPIILAQIIERSEN